MDIQMDEVGKADVHLWDGTRAPLHRFWENEPLVLVFLRHYG